MTGALQAVDAARLLDESLQDPMVAAWCASGPLAVVSAGKAADAMAGTLIRHYPVTRGVVAAPGPGTVVAPQLQRYEAGHPLPTDGSVAAGRRALEIATSLISDERLVVLLSGGASALLAVPLEGLTLQDKIRATEGLLGAGAEIHSLNTVRKHLSAIKGGRLAMAAASGHVLTLAISDVVGPTPDDPSAIGSGPTVADPTTFREALSVIERHLALQDFPRAARAILESGARGERPESPKPGDRKLADSRWHLVGNRHDAMRGARKVAEALGYDVTVVESPLTGEAREAGRRHAHRLLAIREHARGPGCVVSSGESTVRVVGRGRGGRNQEVALAAALELSLASSIVMASVGTDGIDGPTDAAGAVVDTDTIARAEARGVSPHAHLAENDAYTFFEALGDLIVTGPTGTNVGDLQVALIG